MPRIAIYVEGGLVQGILSDVPGLEATVYDYDAADVGDEPLSHLLVTHVPSLHITPDPIEEEVG